MSSPIKNYALIQDEDPQAVVKAVSDACKDGFQPLGGIACVREPANPQRGIVAGRTLYTQAMIRLWQPGEQLTVNGKIHLP